jgi:uncharacterized DUF497 family protein
MRPDDPDDDSDLAAKLEAYLDPPADRHPDMRNVEIQWVEDDDRLGVEHIKKHGVTPEEVRQVILETPPMVESKRSRQHPERTLFWGATRADRWLFIVCEDWREGSNRILKPITAFEPEEGEAYWRQQ